MIEDKGKIEEKLSEDQRLRVLKRTSDVSVTLVMVIGYTPLFVLSIIFTILMYRGWIFLLCIVLGFLIAWAGAIFISRRNVERRFLAGEYDKKRSLVCRK